MMRWYRLKGVESCDQWIGYSTDEQDRVGEDRKQWCHLVYPLIEKGISRSMCAAIIKGAGLPPPNKSRCWCCPHQTAEEWLEVKSRPDEFAAAVSLEKQVNENDPDDHGDLFLYSGRVPLDMADFATDSIIPARLCETGHCWT